MKALYGIKRGMTRLFNEDGESVPVTILEFQPNVVHQVKTKDTDGYEAVQVGFQSQKAQRVNRAETGHLSKAKKGISKYIREIRLDKRGQEALKTDATYELGQELKADEIFEAGQFVDVVGTSIGKGFAGVMKRHGMKGAQTMTHGTHEYFRHGGSIGNRKFPGRVFKNKRMAGQMGGEQKMQEGLRIEKVFAEDHAVAVRGSVPGSNGSVVFMRESLKRVNKNK